MILGIAPQESSYLILAIMCYGFYKMSLLDSLCLFIISIPFFMAFPANRFSDSMSVWRILIGVLFLKVVYEKTDKFHSPERLWSRCAGWRNKQWIALGFHRAIATMEPAEGRAKSGFRLWITDMLKIKKTKANNYRNLLNLFILFLAINVISLFFAQYTGAGIKKISFIVDIVLLFPVTFYAIRKEGDAVSLLKYVFYASFEVVIIGYLQFFLTFFISLSKFWEFWTGSVIKVFYGQNLSYLLSYSNTWFSYYETLPPTLRMFSVFPDSHSFPMFVLISMPIVLSLIFYYRGRRKNFYIACLIIYLLSIYFSGSRGVWVSSAFAFLSCFALFAFPKINKDIFSKIKNSSKKEINSRMIIASVALFFILFPISSFLLTRNQEVQLARSGIGLDEDKENAMFRRILSISDLSEMSNKGRIQIWIETISYIGKHPLLGIGPGNFPLVLDQDLSSSKKGSSAHNIYLDIAVETGIFGLIFFVLIVLEILNRSRKLFYRLKPGYAKIFAGAFFVYFFWISFYGLFDVVILNDKVLIFLVIVIGILYSLEGLECETESRG